MTYVLYNTETRRAVRSFETERGAKISLASFTRKGFSNLAIMEDSIFQEKYNKWTTVKNMLSGREVRIREQEVGGCCDPSTETYWSM